jgi:hypothetical protein
MNKTFYIQIRYKKAYGYVLVVLELLREVSSKLPLSGRMQINTSVAFNIVKSSLDFLDFFIFVQTSGFDRRDAVSSHQTELKSRRMSLTMQAGARGRVR